MIFFREEEISKYFVLNSDNLQGRKMRKNRQNGQLK